MSDTTRQKQLLEALEEGDRPEDLTCFWQDQHGEYSYDDEPKPIQRGGFADLPNRPFDSGFGGTEGEPCIAFSERYVYICWQYDGAEDMTAIPRHPEYVTAIPWPGG